MKGLGIRSKVAEKMKSFVKTAQEEVKEDELETVEEDEGVPEEIMEETDEAEEKVEEKPEGVEEGIGELSEKMDSVEEILESVVDALEEQKDVLESVVNDDVLMEDKFEEVQDEEDLEVSPEEMGVDTDSLITGKEKEEACMNKLRSARKERVKNAKEEKESKTLSEEFKEPESTKKTFKPEAPAPEITKVKESEVPSMLKLSNLSLDLDETNKSWKVLDGEVAKYEIPYNEKHGDKFATKEFAVEVINAMKDSGVEETLKSYDAKEVKVSEVKATEEKKDEVKVAEEKIEEVKEEVVESTQQLTASDVQRKFVRAFKLATVAMHKNLTGSNPLKAAFYQILSDCGMDGNEAKTIIEAAFAQAADENVDVAIEEANKYMQYSDESFVEMESAIGDMSTKDAEMSVQPAKLSEEATQLRARASKSSLPISTASSSDASDKFSHLQSVIDTYCAPKLAGISRYPVPTK